MSGEVMPPLLRRDSAITDKSTDSDGLSKLQPCANFLLNCETGNWYKGKIHKQISSDSGVFRKMIQAYRNLHDKKYTIFVSHKFEHELNSIPRTFCVTFRRERDVDHDIVGGYSNDYYIRVSLIERDDSYSGEPRKDSKHSRILHIAEEIPIKCRGKESLIIRIGEPVSGKDPGITFGSTSEDFSSITSGNTVNEISIVKDMKELNDENYPPETGEKSKLLKFTEFFKNHINPHMPRIGEILVKKCDPHVSTDSIDLTQGGATRRHTRLTRRRKGVFKRKCKKSYRKKKYGKTKKSRRFRRSVRSRR